MEQQNRSLGEDMRRKLIGLNTEEIRRCTRTALDALDEKAIYGCSIFIDNISYHTLCSDADNKNDSKLEFVVDGGSDIMQLWSQCAIDQSSNVACIPPEVILEAGDKSKVDSWAVGCLVVQLLSSGEPLRLRRHRRYTPGVEYFCVSEPSVQDRLKVFYAGIGEERDMVAGPEITVNGVPRLLEDFLAQCFHPVPAQRWSIEQLKTHPFADLHVPLQTLLARDEESYQMLPIVNNFTVNNLREHPDLRSSTADSMLVGDSPNIRECQLNGTPVDVWKFKLPDDIRHRDWHTQAYGKLLDLLTFDRNNTDHTATGHRADCYRIRSLQPGHQNIVLFYGCEFEPQIMFSPPNFVIFAEHCAGGTFELAASRFRLPMEIISKWIEQVLHGMDFLHRHGIAHLRLNRKNIFFAGPALFTGPVKIGGFHDMRQLAESIPVKPTATAKSFVSPAMRRLIMSDTLTNNISVGRKSDIWSVGCVVQHLATGKDPLHGYRSADSKVTVAEYLNSQQIPSVPEWVPKRLRAFIEKCLQPNPADPLSAAQLLTEEFITALSRKGSALVDEKGENYLDFKYNDARGSWELPQEVLTYWAQQTDPSFPKTETFGKTCQYHYDLTDKIGSGAFGCVYRATITEHGNYTGEKYVAVKTIILKKGAEFSDKPKKWQWSIEKWKALLQLSHNNLVAFHKVTILPGSIGTFVELMMDICLGGNLNDFLKKLKGDRQLLEPAAAVKYATEITEGVNFLHNHKKKNNIIHGDLKPSNVLIKLLDNNEKRMMIGDCDDHNPMQGTVTGPNDIPGLCGTDRYMSPEILNTFVAAKGTAQPPGRKTDIWSLGCIFMEIADAVTGNNIRWLHNKILTKKAGEAMTNFEFISLIIGGYIPVITQTPAVPIGFRLCIAHCLLPESKNRISAADLAKRLQDETKQYRTAD